MKLKLVYLYEADINNHMICVVYNEKGRELARGYHSRLFEEAKREALREAQRISAIEPIIIPRIEYVDVNW